VRGLGFCESTGRVFGGTVARWRGWWREHRPATATKKQGQICCGAWHGGNQHRRT